MISKIKSQEELDKKNRRNQLIIGIVMIGLLVLSTLGFSLVFGGGGASGQDAFANQVTEEGITFTQGVQGWSAAIEGGIFYFSNLPSEVKETPIEGELDFNRFRGSVVYFVGDNPAIQQSLINFQGRISRTQEACLEGFDCENNIPTKSCDSSNLIIYGQGNKGQGNESEQAYFVNDYFPNANPNETSVYAEGSCVFLTGDALKATDAFMYKSLKVF